ncbi:MAG: DNA cytosine methyltransferase, partial [Bacteroidota bacterium]
MKNSYITITDQFCGAGGSSQGARRLGQRIKGIEVKLALNHWKLAIETHQHNFVDTMHECTDISACDPRRYPSTDVLITSPECTNHTLAKGIKIVKNQMDMFDKGVLDASAERSRATMWDVPRFAEYHKYNLIIVENVVDARKWVMFDAWIMAMDLLGYNYRCVYANSMFFHPTPQSRDRMYVVFWKKGNPTPDLDYRPAAHCPKCDKNVNAIQRWKTQGKNSGKYKTQYYYCCPVCGQQVTPYYYAAFNCIDWSDIGQRIGDRKKALSEKTNRR